MQLTSRNDRLVRSSPRSGRANVLFFAQQQAWPVDTGARIRNYHLARQLAKRCSVTFVELVHGSKSPPNLFDDSGFANVVTLPKGRPYTLAKILRGLLGPTPISVLNCWSSRAASQLAQLLQCGHFDSVQIEGVHLIGYLPIIQNAPGNPVIVVDWHNIESELMWRYAGITDDWLKKIAARRTAKLIENAEDRLLNACHAHTVTSERERQELLARRPDTMIRVIPNGVDAGSFSAKEMAGTCLPAGEPAARRDILFVGSMDYHANIDAVTWFARAAWPEIARNHPDLHFRIVGRDPASEVRALASESIHIAGTVPDVRPFYASAVAVVVPLRSGSGTRLKILEAMAAEVPVVSTRLGIEGINARDGVHFLLADSVPEIVSAVRLLASSVDTRLRLSANARALVVGQYDWSSAGEQLYGIHHDLVESKLNGLSRAGAGAISFAF